MGQKINQVKYIVLEVDADNKLTGLCDGWYSNEKDAQQISDHMNEIKNGFSYFVDNNHEVGDFAITQQMSLKKKALAWNQVASLCIDGKFVLLMFSVYWLALSLQT